MRTNTDPCTVLTVELEPRHRWLHNHLRPTINALESCLRRRRRWTTVWAQWITVEPDLAGWTLDRFLMQPRQLGDAELRALIRIARSELPMAEVAGHIIVFTRIPRIAAAVRREEPDRAGEAVADWLAHLWDLILAHRFSTTSAVWHTLNSGSGFAARCHPERRRSGPAISMVHHVDPIDQADNSDAYSEIDWECSAPNLARQWTDIVLEAMTGRKGWHPGCRTYEEGVDKIEKWVDLMMTVERLPYEREAVAAGLPATSHRTFKKAVLASAPVCLT